MPIADIAGGAAAATRPIVEIRGLRKRFGANEVLKGIDLSVKRDKVIAIIGKSGSGKSTLLRCMNALETIQGGEIVICGHDVGGGKSNRALLRRDVGMVFQSYNLFPHLTAERNITLALTLVKKQPKPEALRMSLATTFDSERSTTLPRS